MAKGPEKPPLTLVGSMATTASPPRQLGPHGLALWNGILSEYGIQDRAGLELLAQASACLDRAEGLAEEINAVGAVITTRAGVRAHPAIRDETACRTACVRILEKLGVTREPLQPSGGRPPQRWRG
jgi:hypothetical protein